MTKVRFTTGLFFLAFLVSATSCITIDPTIGSNNIPTNHIFTVRHAQFDVPVDLRPSDSIQASSVGSPVFGSMTTETFGKVKSSVAMSVVPSTDSIIWGKDPKFVSMDISIPVTTLFTESDDQANIPQNVYIYRLKGPVDTLMHYSCDLKESYIDFNDKVSKGNIVYTGTSYLTCRFTEEFGRQFFDYSMEMLDSTDYFLNEFPGIFLTTDDCEENSLGGRLSSLDLTNAVFQLSYKSTDDDGFETSKNVSFSLGPRTLNLYLTESAKYEGSSTGEYIVSDGLSGIKPVVDAKKMKKMLEDWAAENNFDLNRILINRAVLEFPFEYEGYSSCFDRFPSCLYPCYRVESSVYKDYYYFNPIEDVQDNDSILGTINRGRLCYSSDIGIYLQSLIKKDDSKISLHDDMWMMSIFSNTDSNTNTTSFYADYLTYYQCILNGTDAERKPKLEITYVVVNE